MKKLSIIITTLFLISSFIFTEKTLAAEEQTPYVKSANIEIILEDNTYLVKEKVEVDNITESEDRKVEHLVKQITENKVKDVKISSNGIELIPEIIKGENLDRYVIKIGNEDEEVAEYLIEYKVNKAEGIFEVPLFVPEYEAQGEQRNIHISFQAPEGQVIQKNSFPILNESGLNMVEKDMANIPAMTKFLYAEKTKFFNSFNIISTIALLSLFLMLLYWGIYEKRKNRREANGN